MPKAESEEEAQKKKNMASKIKKRHAAGTWLLTLPLTFESHGVWTMQYSTALLTEFSRYGLKDG
jgi:hypothetical protein